MNLISKRTIVLGVTGGIAAYKAADLASKLTQAGAQVDVIMTRAAQEFITPLTFQALTGRPVFTSMFGPGGPTTAAIPHLELARRADLLVIAPATAHVVAKLALGLADDLLSTIALAATCPLVIAPAMETHMWQHPATQDNITRLTARGAYIIGPVSGRLASGTIGLGRMVEPVEIMDHLAFILSRGGPLAGKRIVVSAAGTREPLDPVRVISNRSSGKMGFALATAARDRGAEVTLVTGPTPLSAPVGIRRVDVETAEEMRRAVLDAVQGAHALIMAAAVADYRPTEVATQKIKKADEELVITLTRTVDILSEVAAQRLPLILVGFAAETQETIRYAQEKLIRKGLDLVVANDITAPGSGFGTDTNQVTLVYRDGRTEPLPLLPKSEVAERVLDAVDQLLHERFSP
jgi:phosphopantothenoylcysteine decarboxylase/phosphopantothenate--cysteine ligase